MGLAANGYASIEAVVPGSERYRPIRDVQVGVIPGCICAVGRVINTVTGTDNGWSKDTDIRGIGHLRG